MLRTLALVSMLFPAVYPAFAQMEARPIHGTHRVVNNGPGDQTDPHVSGALVAYTNEVRGTSEIRYHDLASGQDAAIPNEGAFDFVSDVSGGTVVFTRVSASSSIYTFDVGPEATPVEVAPEAGCSRRAAVIGGRTVAWQDFGYTGNSLQPEIATYDLDRDILTRLTNDTLQDRTPSVAPDGRTVVWAKCDAQGLRCDIWEARWSEGGFVTQALTGAEGEDSQPDTNGQVVVYASTRTVDGVTDRDIYWKPVGGGAEQRLALPGLDANPSISGSLVAFERRAPGKSDFDIALYDLASQTLYVLTSGVEDENLNDLSVDADGQVRVVWTAPASGDFNVHSFTFQLQEEPHCDPGQKEGRLPIQVCFEPENWPLLTSVELTRTTGGPNSAEFQFPGSGVGVLCVDNGYSSAPATSGWVWLNGHEKVTPAQFKPDVSLIAAGVVMGGDNLLKATISGSPGSSFRLRVYGMPPKCEADDAPGQQQEPGAMVIPGQRVQPMALQSEAVSPMTFIPEGKVRVLGPVPGGCSTGGGSLALVGLMVVALWLARPQRVGVVARRKELRREPRAL
ncbi:TolB family protein [Pyxidicoccus trucidator]|uniref:TolB family protein n=1 Tax=Pyxidicoccus trucidator TaxID=2709662 RepID=UPI0013D9FD46|nr:PD40 domain-containing protein [Pyxidicoccus trucidator]